MPALTTARPQGLPRSSAFQISDEDVANILFSNTLCGKALATMKERNWSVPDLAESLLKDLDHAQIEDAAMMADSMEDQVDCAHDEITRQLRAAGWIEDASEEALRPSEPNHPKPRPEAER